MEERRAVRSGVGRSLKVFEAGETVKFPAEREKFGK